MKLIIAVVNRRDARALRDRLVQEGFRFTEISSTGGFLGLGNVTLLMGVEQAEVEPALQCIRDHCQSREEVVSLAVPDTRLYANPIGESMTVPIGGAQVFVLSVERFERV
ncbi:MAG: cyclic-di-AMP receptor [Candidatus Zipacnadales bacterium]